VIDVSVRAEADGWIADVTVHGARATTHRVRISAAELERYYGAGDVAELVRRSFAFLLEREPSTSILREFDLSVIERYFPEYATEIRR
jgi:hypothetical protein